MRVKEQIIQQVSAEQSAQVLICSLSGLADCKLEETLLFVSQVFLFYLGFALRAHDLPPLLRAPPSPNALAK